MKRKIGLLILSALLLTGCGETESPKEENNNPEPEVIENKEENKDDSKAGDNPSGGEEDGENKVEASTYSATVITTGSSFEAALSKRVQLSNESNFQGNVTILENYIKTFCEKDGCLTRLTFGGFVQTLDAAEGQFISLGSSSADGDMTWYSSLKIVKVEVTVINYYKTYSYTTSEGPVNGVSCDNYAHFKIDSNDYSLEIDSDAIPEEKTFTVNYGNEGVNSFKVASVGGRVLLKKFTITWKE